MAKNFFVSLLNQASIIDQEKIVIDSVFWFMLSAWREKQKQEFSGVIEY